MKIRKTKTLDSATPLTARRWLTIGKEHAMGDKGGKKDKDKKKKQTIKKKEQKVKRMQDRQQKRTP